MATQSNTSSSSISTSTQSPIYLLSNICNLITLHLDSTNYVSWKFQISSILRAHSLMGYIDGSLNCPTKFIHDERGRITTTKNPDYHKWITYDQALMTLINATLSSSALTYVIGYSTSKEVWQALERRFSSSSRLNILQLKSNLHTLSKGTDSVDLYVQRIKQARDSLAAVSVIIEDEDILIHTLNGLPVDYNAFKTSIHTRSQPITLEELHTLLKAEEQTLNSTSVPKSNSLPVFPTTMAASQTRAPTYYNRGRGGRGRSYTRGRGRNYQNFGRSYQQNYGYAGQSSNTHFSGNQSHYKQGSSQGSTMSFPSNQSQISCQICNKPGHQALDCYHRMDYSYQGRHPPQQLTAMAATHNQVSSNPNLWLTDTGATNHITTDFGNLSLPAEYYGDDTIAIGNGLGLSISHIGQSSLHTADHRFTLNNVLHVPFMASNLLSVH
uniref:Uncharacterized protein n=1 Tax=Davidia involucrata TaxID=16924 RepID=A0A5B7C9B1_DAVIN